MNKISEAILKLPGKFYARDAFSAALEVDPSTNRDRVNTQLKLLFKKGMITKTKAPTGKQMIFTVIK